jgi:hypothetical protein
MFLIDPPFLVDVPPLSEKALAKIFSILDASSAAGSGGNKAVGARIVKVTDDIKRHFSACVDIVGNYTTTQLAKLDSGPKNVTVVYASRDRDFEKITTNDVAKWKSVFRSEVVLEMIELECSHFDVVRRPYVSCLFFFCFSFKRLTFCFVVGDGRSHDADLIMSALHACMRDESPRQKVTNIDRRHFLFSCFVFLELFLTRR